MMNCWIERTRTNWMQTSYCWKTTTIRLMNYWTPMRNYYLIQMMKSYSTETMRMNLIQSLNLKIQTNYLNLMPRKKNCSKQNLSCYLTQSLKNWKLRTNYLKQSYLTMN